MDYSKWKAHRFSTGTTIGDDYRKFQNEMAKDLRKQIKPHGFDLVSFGRNHYCFSAVLYHKCFDRYIYISVSDVRPHWDSRTLIRNMQHSKDWTGGMNQFKDWSEIGLKAFEIASKPYR